MAHLPGKAPRQVVGLKPTKRNINKIQSLVRFGQTKPNSSSMSGEAAGRRVPASTANVAPLGQRCPGTPTRAELMLANPRPTPYVSAADGCESGFAAFGQPVRPPQQWDPEGPMAGYLRPIRLTLRRLSETADAL